MNDQVFGVGGKPKNDLDDTMECKVRKMFLFIYYFFRLDWDPERAYSGRT